MDATTDDLTPLLDLSEGVAGRLGSSHRMADPSEWELVLRAKRIPYRISRKGTADCLLTRPEYYHQAVDELIVFEQERVLIDSDPLPLPVRSSHWSVPAVLIALFMIFVLTRRTVFGAAWFDMGVLNGVKILEGGEYWRLVTALTLHADFQHVAGNILIGGFFANWFCRQVGPQVGWTAILLAGVSGNWLNLLVQGSAHHAIGASTAFFGAVGLLAGFRAFYYRFGGFRETVVPLVVGVVIFSFFGVGGERTDIGAHIAGLFCGSLIGAGLAIMRRARIYLGQSGERYLAFLAPGLVMLSWAIAFTVSAR